MDIHLDFVSDEEVEGSGVELTPREALGFYLAVQYENDLKRNPSGAILFLKILFAVTQSPTLDCLQFALHDFRVLARVNPEWEKEEVIDIIVHRLQGERDK